MIYGNITGVRKNVLDRLESLYDLTASGEEFLPLELLPVLCEATEDTGREICVYLGRGGIILEVSIGDQNTVGLHAVRRRGNVFRLCRVRCIHTHPNGDARLSEVDISALRSLLFDSMVAVGVQDAKAVGVQAAFLGEDESNPLSVYRTEVTKPGRIPQLAWLERIENADRVVRASPIHDNGGEREKALLLSIHDEGSLDELQRLAETAGADTIKRVTQKRDKPETGTYIGSGKLRELSLLCQALEVDTVIVDDELTSIQLRNMEAELMDVKVVDRTTLILDIFAQRAKTREGVLQVEIAQMTYQLPRLLGHGISMSRLGGGIGTRGPGETQLESDRRAIRRRLTELKRQLEELKAQRRLRRAKRNRNAVPLVALVGYTNTGKSTLLNSLTHADAFAQDMLFATLDPLSRRIQLPGSREILLTDTVGFVSRLPHTLVEAFQSTLEEVVSADLIVLVSDATSPEIMSQHDVVMEVLKTLGADEIPVINAINKTDLAQSIPEFPGAVYISAKTGDGLDKLLAAIDGKLSARQRSILVRVPFSSGQALSLIYGACTVISEEYEDAGYVFHLKADTETSERLSRMLGEDHLVYESMPDLI